MQDELLHPGGGGPNNVGVQGGQNLFCLTTSACATNHATLLDQAMLLQVMQPSSSSSSSNRSDSSRSCVLESKQAAYLQLMLFVLQVQVLGLQIVTEVLEAALTLTYFSLPRVQSALPLCCPL